MEALGTDTPAVIVLATAVLLVASGIAKKRLVWKRPKPAPARRPRRNNRRSGPPRT
jgi:hypothetical protein